MTLTQRYALIVLAVFSLLGSDITVDAQELPTLYRGVRPLGMGGAFTAVSDDANAFFYNPAGLHGAATLFSMEILNPQVEISANSTDLYSDLSDLEGDNLSEVSAFLDERIGELQHVRASLFPNLLIRNFGVGILAQATADILVRNPVFPEVVTDVKIDTGLVGGGAIAVGNGLTVGVDAKFIQRKGISQTFTAVDIAGENFDPLDDLESESGITFDLGGMMKLKEHVPSIGYLDPTVGVVIQNAPKLDFDTLGELPTQFNAGLAVNPSLGVVSSTFAFDVLDITKRVGEDDDYNKRLHLGAEIRLPAVLSVRLGLNQMKYVSAGATVDIWIMKLDYATYAEEVGVFAGQRDDRRHVVQLSFGF
jgi:hypothetical protein